MFWVHRNATLAICLAAGLAVWFTARHRWNERALLWFDALGLAAYSTYGASKALAYGIAPIPAFAMGVLTACAGGIIRDVLAGDPSILMRPEIYVTAAALSSALFVLLHLAGLPVLPAAVLAFIAAFTLRALAISKGLKLPGYSAR